MRLFADFEAIKIGDREEVIKVITQEDIRRFVEMTGDDNPLHVDTAFAETTSFKGIVVHGMLGASFISTVIGTKLPGPGALWVSQNLEFLQPVRLGDELSISCTVKKKHDRERLVELETLIVNQNKQTVLVGQGKVKVLASRPAPSVRTPESLKVAIVTGGAGGLGSGICKRLAKDGFNVVVNYLGSRESAERLVAEINTGKSRAIAVQADVSTAAGAAALHSAAVRTFGGVSVLINNASTPINPKPFASMEWSDFQKHIDVLVKGAFLITQVCIAGMAEQKFGRIVTITSQAIDGSPTVSWTGYATAKAAIAKMSLYLAAEFGPSGITVNCLSPGMSETPLIGNVPEKVQMMIARQTPLRRLALPEDVAAAVAYLVSEDGNFVTGHTLHVNGGSFMS